MVVRDELIRKRVLSIGTSVPMETSEGLDAVQQPLRDRYPIDESKQIEGILAYLTVSQSGLQMEYCNSSKDVILFPIASVTLCAAVRCISVINNATKERVAKFVSLSSVAAGGANAKRPAIFTAITRRTSGKKVLECHGFVCESDRDALDLVQATSAADKMSKGKIMNGSFTMTHAHDTNTFKSSMNGNSENYNMRLKSGEVRNTAPEFFDTTPQQGYFYTSKSNVPIKKYTMEKVVSDGESERIRATSPTPLSARPSLDRRSAYSFQTTTRTGPPPPVLHTLPRPAPNMIPVRTVPAHSHVRPRFFSPPPTILRQKVFPSEPYVMVGHPPPHPVVIDGPPHLIRGRPRRRGSESSASHSHEHASSRSSSPREYPRRTMNGDGDVSSEVSSRPRTPPTDYDKGRSKARVSRREQHEMRQPNFYPSVLRNGDVYPPGAPYDFYPPPPGRIVYVDRARSVPPPVDRARTLENKKKKNKKDKKNKKRTNGVPSDISTDSIGYMSEQGSSSHRPRDFRRFENQFKHERAFSRSLMEQNKRGGPHDNQSYALNELMASKGRNGEPEPFAMY